MRSVLKTVCLVRTVAVLTCVLQMYEIHRCILVTLTTNREVFLYSPSKDPIKGTWDKVSLFNILLPIPTADQ